MLVALSVREVSGREVRNGREMWMKNVKCEVGKYIEGELRKQRTNDYLHWKLGQKNTLQLRGEG